MTMIQAKRLLAAAGLSVTAIRTTIESARAAAYAAQTRIQDGTRDMSDRAYATEMERSYREFDRVFSDFIRSEISQPR